MKVFDELRKRKVLQTAALYFAVAWGATEVLSYLIERIPIFPAWADTAIAILFVMGFPVTVFLAWMFDVGEGGVRRADPTTGLGKGVIALSVAGLLVATGALSYLIWPRVQAELGIVQAGDFGTVAVLPLENLTGDPSLGYLGVGLAEDIRQRLLAQTDLKVIGRVSMAGFSGAGTDLASIRNLLDAGHALEGILQEVAGRMQVSVSLLDTATGKQVWGNTFSTDEGGWDPLRQRIVTSLAEQLALTVRVREAENAVPAEALEAYLHGLSELNQPDIADRWFDEAVRLAPNFADAWARKALLRVDMVWKDKPIEEAWVEAEPMFRRAREIDPHNLLADIAEASLLWVTRLDPFASYEVMKRAEVRAPNHPLVLGGMATALGFTADGKKEAVAYGRRYVAQDPLSPDAHNRLGLALNFNSKMDEALRENQRAIDLDPHFKWAWDYRANWQFYKNRQADAMVTLTRRARMENPASDETLRCMFQVAGALLPDDRAIPLLQDAVRRELGMTQSHWWCSNPLELLVWRLRQAEKSVEAEAAEKELEQWQEATGATRTDDIIIAEPELYERCEDELCRLRASMGEDEFEAWLSVDPPLQYFNFSQAVDLIRALNAAERVGEGRRLAMLSAPVAREFAGPTGHPSTTIWVVKLYALSGDVETALDYAEQVGPEGFFMFGVGELHNPENELRPIRALEENPRWRAFLERCRARWMEEVEKFDRLVESGEIVMP